MVEGIWGSGKTITAQIIQKKLLNRRKKHELFLEGNLKHPADYDGVGYLNIDEYEELTRKYQDFGTIIRNYTEEREGNRLVYYKRMVQENHDVPPEVTSFVSQFDVYDGNLPIETHMNLVLSKWKEFAEIAKETDKIWTFECCFLQNPMTAMLAKYNATDEVIKIYMQALAEIIAPLDPALIYLYQDDIKKTFEKACHERPIEWVNGVTHYVTSQGYGKAEGLEGSLGTIAWLEKRKQLELEVLSILPFESLIMDNSDQNWNRINKEIDQLLNL